LAGAQKHGNYSVARTYRTAKRPMQNRRSPRSYADWLSQKSSAGIFLWLSAGALALWSAPLFAGLAAERSDQPSQDPNAFVRDVLRHEVDAELHDQALWSYHETKIEDGKEKLYRVYQTKEGDVERLAAVSGEPISQAQAHAEDARITNLVSHPKEMRQEQKKKSEDGEHARNLLNMFPDAFLFQYAGTQGDLVRLKFKPNPRFHAEGHPAQVFHHMEGMLTLDAAHKRLVEIDGELMSEVKFGGGLLGHLDPGGTFHVKQEEVSPGYWEVTVMHVEMKGKALFFKTIGAHEEESYANFKQVPDDTSLQQAAAFTRKNSAGN
jgi:hypothetical protein